MEADFWHERWSLGQIGFHQAEVNPKLLQCFPGLQLQAAAHILVPLCGKSLDMLWLWQLGHHVTGVELNRQACVEFFNDNDLRMSIEQRGEFEVFKTDRLELYCGDFLGWQGSHTPVDAVYDRAALIALPPAMRKAYCAHLLTVLTAGTRGLLITLEYPQQQKKGPPFAVVQNEVESLFGGCKRLELLQREDILAAEPRFRDKGVTALFEAVYRFIL